MFRPQDVRKAQAAARRNVGIYRISGENVTLKEIAERLGVTESVAEGRMRTARQLPGVITWERLRR